MKVLDIAMQREKEAEAYYRELAEKAGEAGLTAILNRLAETERKHYESLQCLQKRGDCEMEDDAVAMTEIRARAAELSAKAAGFSFDISQVDLYKHAQEREQESRAFYLAKAEEVGSLSGKKMFEKLARQEEIHFQILESLIEFVSMPEPGKWLENAEWYHSDEY